MTRAMPFADQPFTPVIEVAGDPACGWLLLCDHARAALPAEHGDLGLPPVAFERHISHDIGAEALTRALARRLGAPAVMAGFSRLLIDPNRGEDDPTIVMRLSDGQVVPGNHPLPADVLARRIARFHRPYHEAIDAAIGHAMAAGVRPIIFSVHSFTPAWKGVPRPWHATMLYDRDDRLARCVIDALTGDPAFARAVERQGAARTFALNEPYDGALRGDTIHRHCTLRGLASGLIEVRQDLLAAEDGPDFWAQRLAPILDAANADPTLHEEHYPGSRTDRPSRRAA